MTIMGNGNVRIGTTSPGHKLDVNGTGNFTLSSPDPFNTVQVPLILINGAGNGGAGAQMNFVVGPQIRGLIDWPSMAVSIRKV